jgi:hypothetical protein
VTEAEWLVATDPVPMLGFLRERAGDRKVRLFACACCRALWDDRWPQRSRDVILTAERFADGLATEQELNRSRSLACQSAQNAVRHGSRRRFGHSGWAFESLLFLAADAALARHQIVYTMTVSYPTKLARGDEGVKALAPAVLRDLFGPLPFRPVTTEPEWRTSAVLDLAGQVYESRNYSLMPILADALQDAGCDNADVLEHCRRPGEHVRGCWVVDLVLGKG